MSRCFDCFHDFGPREERFAVLKKLRDLPEGFQYDAGERLRLESLTYDQVFVCEDCAAWYGDHPIRLAAIEADPDRGLA